MLTLHMSAIFPFNHIQYLFLLDCLGFFFSRLKNETNTNTDTVNRHDDVVWHKNKSHATKVR